MNPQRRPPLDPTRQALVVVRRSLFRLHKTLIDAERRALERERGPMSSGQFLQVLIHDPALLWLQPFTAVIVEIDQALSSPEGVTRARAREFILRVRELIEPADERVEEHYAGVRQRDPDALVAHVELEANIRAALQQSTNEGGGPA